jgi:hypothetical protein
MTTLMTSARRSLRLTRSCDIRRVPSPAATQAARVTVVAGLACSNLYPASLEQVERAGMATTARLLVCYTAASELVEVDQRLATGGREYRIRGVSGWPWASPAFLELLLEDES